MGTKMKGLLKGLRYISQIFDEEKEPEIEIGFPTDVKHVAHIGRDGPSVDSPSWMKEFRSSTDREDSEIKGVSEDTRRRSTRSSSSPNSERPELPKSSRSRRNFPTDNNPSESPRKKESSRSRQSRRNSTKEERSSNRQQQLLQETSNSPLRNLIPSDPNFLPSRLPQETSSATNSPARNLPDAPKKTRRKKYKELVGASGSKAGDQSPSGSSYTSPYSDPGPGTEAGPPMRPIPSLYGKREGM